MLFSPSPNPYMNLFVSRLLVLFVVGGCFLYILKLHFYPEECDRTKTPYVDLDRVRVGIFWYFSTWLKQKGFVSPPCECYKGL